MMRAVDQKPECHLEWPNKCIIYYGRNVQVVPY